MTLLPVADLIQPDVLVFGGGVAGLWTLDAVRRSGRSACLIERDALGAGQTICSQGIVHGGLKYSLGGLLDPSAEAIRDMPALWSDCLRGAALPDLRPVRLLADHGYLWRTRSLRSRAGLLGARLALRVTPRRVAKAERPPPLASCPGDVLRLDEPVVDPASLLAALAELHRGVLLRAAEAQVRAGDSATGIEVTLPAAARGRAPLKLRPAVVVLAAGAGNEALRAALRLPAERMQRRPLHMVMVRGALPALFGHCTDGDRTRVTITSATDTAGRTVRQVGGQLAEEVVQRSREELLADARHELESVLPGVDLSAAELASYRIDRAEARTAGGRRPEDVHCEREGDVVTTWPTKLALAPRLAQRVLELLPPPRSSVPDDVPGERPPVARPPWEQETQWTRVR